MLQLSYSGLNLDFTFCQEQKSGIKKYLCFISFLMLCFFFTYLYTYLCIPLSYLFIWSPAATGVSFPPSTVVNVNQYMINKDM